MVTKNFLFDFVSKYKHAVLSTVTGNNLPESALVGFIATPEMKLFFDTVDGSRKYHNLKRNPHISFVIGWDGDKTLQYEGIAKIPTGLELEKLQENYFKIFPDGIERMKTWSDIAYFVVEPKWIRYSDFGSSPIIEELKF